MATLPKTRKPPVEGSNDIMEASTTINKGLALASSLKRRRRRNVIKCGAVFCGSLLFLLLVIVSIVAAAAFQPTSKSTFSSVDPISFLRNNDYGRGTNIQHRLFAVPHQQQLEDQPVEVNAIPAGVKQEAFLQQRQSIVNNNDKRSSRSSAIRKTPIPQRVQLRWLYQNLEKLLLHDISAKHNQSLLQAMNSLVTAKTTHKILEAGRQLERLDLASSKSSLELYSVEVRERVAKAAAMTGLLHLALHITRHLLHNQNVVPSEMCQDAISQALRKVGKVQRLDAFLMDIGRVVLAADHQATQASSSSTTTNTSNEATTSQFSYNIYLAALCDPIVDRHRHSVDRSFWAPVNATALLERAVSWLDSNKTQSCLGHGLLPDAVSYATVLNAVSGSSSGNINNNNQNSLLAETIWNQAQDQVQRGNLKLTPQLYNARLKSFRGRDDTKALELWSQISSSSTGHGGVKSDRYTIDLMLLPLLRAGRIGEIEKVLDHFVCSNSDTVVSNSFEAFLWTLVDKGGDVGAARAIFDVYIAPALEPVMSYYKGSTMRVVRPRTRHFTVLMEGYKQQVAASQQKEIAAASTITRSVSNKTAIGFEAPGFLQPEVVREEAWRLYDMMRQSPKTPPDVYTITTMMGVCRSSPELTDLLGEAIHDFGLNCSSVFLRAAMTAYGNLGDPSSACHLFATFMETPASTRYWNVLLGAIVKSTGLVSVGNNSTRRRQTLDVLHADSTRILERSDCTSLTVNDKDLILKLDGLSCWEVADTIVNRYVQQPNAQTFCLLAKAAQSKPADADLALEIFRNASSAGVPADGRFVNAVIRCFGSDVDAAIAAWKSQIRPACLKHETRERSKPMSPSRVKGKNLLAPYHALLFVCGRAFRPDLALRLVYAMSKEGLEANEVALNCYEAGKRTKGETTVKKKMREKLRELLKMVDAYESLLYVECIKYDKRDKRRAGEKSIRIIL